MESGPNRHRVRHKARSRTLLHVQGRQQPGRKEHLVLEVKLAIHEVDKLEHVLDLALHVIGTAENVCIVLLESTHSRQACHIREKLVKNSHTIGCLPPPARPPHPSAPLPVAFLPRSPRGKPRLGTGLSRHTKSTATQTRDQ
jgi:hypothetical protein